MYTQVSTYGQATAPPFSSPKEKVSIKSIQKLRKRGFILDYRASLGVK